MKQSNSKPSRPCDIIHIHTHILTGQQFPNGNHLSVQHPSKAPFPNNGFECHPFYHLETQQQNVNINIPARPHFCPIYPVTECNPFPIGCGTQRIPSEKQRDENPFFYFATSSLECINTSLLLRTPPTLHPPASGAETFDCNSLPLTRWF